MNSLDMHPRYLQAAIIFAATLLVGMGLRDIALNDNVNSRLASAYSLVHQGTWKLDTAPLESPNFFAQNTVDKVKIDGHFYSTKPPLMPLFMAVQYWGLNRVFGWTLHPDSDAKIIIQTMTLILSVLPFCLTLILFSRILSFFVENARHQTLPLFALAFATQVPGFATGINNHTTGLFLLSCSIYLALGMGLGALHPKPWRFALFGFCGALTFAIELPMTIFIAASGLYLFAKYPKQAMLIAVPVMCVPLAVHFGLMLWISGSPLPIQMREELYLFEGSYWRVPGGMDALNEAKGTYLFHASLGRHGIFSLFPILSLGLVGCAMAIFKRNTDYRAYILASALLCGIVFSYYILGTNNYGGAAYGFRWMIGLMPILLLMASPVWNANCGYARAVLITCMLAVSMYSAWECYHYPWDANAEWTCHPKLFGPSFIGPE